ncbi:MAG: hypothetical protein GY754_10605 [bacterium]|nr:hypothetical protein [bacterium]
MNKYPLKFLCSISLVLLIIMSPLLSLGQQKKFKVGSPDSSFRLSKEEQKNLIKMIPYSGTVSIIATISSRTFDADSPGNKPLSRDGKTAIMNDINSLSKKLSGSTPDIDLHISIAQKYEKLENMNMAYPSYVSALKMLKILEKKDPNNIAIMEKIASTCTQLNFFFPSSFRESRELSREALKYLFKLNSIKESSGRWLTISSLYAYHGDRENTFSALMKSLELDTNNFNALLTFWGYYYMSLHQKLALEPDKLKSIYKEPTMTIVKKYPLYEQIQLNIKNHPENIRYKTLFHFIRLSHLSLKSLSHDSNSLFTFKKENTAFSPADVKLISETEKFFLSLTENNEIKKTDLFSWLAMIYLFRKDREKSLIFYEKAFALDKSNGELCNILLYFYGHDSKEYNKALSIINQKINANPKPGDYLSRTIILSNQKKYTHAILSTKKALRLSPSSPKAHLYLAITFLKARKIDDSKKALEKTFSFKIPIDHNVRAHSVGAAIALIKNNPNAAFQLLTLALKLDPSDKITRKILDSYFVNGFSEAKKAAKNLK